MLHWGVLLEIGDGYARIGRRAKGVIILERLENEYPVYSITEELLQQAVALYRNRADKEWGLTDCVSFVVMQRDGIAEALTADIHFRQAGFTPLLLQS